MSVSLVVVWSDGTDLVVNLGTLRGVKSGWSEVGEKLGLRHVPMFFTYAPVTPGNLEEIISEVEVLTAEFVRRWGDAHDETSKVSYLHEVLCSMRSRVGWSALIG